jgi:malonyl-CoA O-methyltransferase
VTAGRQRSLTGKSRLQAMVQAYEAFRLDGRLPASYEVVYGHAWAPRQRSQDGVTCIPLEGLKIGR